MDHDLQIENQYLRRQLQSLLTEARQNEEKMRRFDRLERRLIGAHTPAELVRIILQDYRAVFELDAVGLLLVDPEYEITRMLDAELKDSRKAASLTLLVTRSADVCAADAAPRFSRVCRCRRCCCERSC